MFQGAAPGDLKAPWVSSNVKRQICRGGAVPRRQSWLRAAHAQWCLDVESDRGSNEKIGVEPLTNMRADFAALD